MKVLRLYYLLPPKDGGMEKHIYELSLQQKKYCDVSIMFNYGDSLSSNDIQVLKGIKLYKIRPLFIGITLFYIAVLIRLILKNQKFDVIHIHGDWSSLLFVKMIKLLVSAKVAIFSIHGQLTNNYAHQKLLPRLLKNVDLIFSTGFETGKGIEQISNKKVIVQPSGINNIFFAGSTRKNEFTRFQVISVANLYPIKNIDLILEIAKEMIETDFLIVGEGIEKERLQKEIIEKEISNVKLLGFKNFKELKSLYDQSNCYLHTSFAEGTPTSVLEAMACGLPIVSSNAGGLNHIIKEFENGFIIDNFSKNEFISRLTQLKEDNLLREKMSINNCLLSQNYRWEKVAQTITDKTNECLNEKS